MSELPTKKVAGDPDSLRQRVVEALDRFVRPRVQAHGGDITLEGLSGGTVVLRFHAACQACPLKPVTLFVTARNALLQIPGVEEVEAVGVRVPESVRSRLAVLTGDP